MQQTTAELPSASAWSEQWHRLFQPRQGLFGPLEFLQCRLPGTLTQATSVRPGVVSDPVPFAARATRQIQTCGCADLLPQHEECGFNAMLPEAIEHQWCSLRFRTVIESKSDLRQPLPP